eukprot:756165-Hanusia_phi.AAC.1
MVANLGLGTSLEHVEVDLTDPTRSSWQSSRCRNGQAQCPISHESLKASRWEQPEASSLGVADLVQDQCSLCSPASLHIIGFLRREPRRSWAAGSREA